jgi:DAK2 domain fusion protein YloV
LNNNKRLSEVKAVEENYYDGQTLKQAFKSAELVLEKKIDEVNSLNVFPVPDGDTGINLYLTLQSANDAVKDLSSISAAEIASKAAMGALLGARGNSGVIFSQIMRGFARGLESKVEFSPFDFAEALKHASATAYQAIENPVEGTILTVIREASEKAAQQAMEGANLKKTITAATSQAKNTVARTPEILPALKEAGVVDAGGKGLFYFFQGMKNFIAHNENPVEENKNVRRRAKVSAQSVYGYDLQFLVTGNNLSVEEIRQKISTMGESVLVVGDENLIRVHIHTKKSQAVMDYCAAKGSLSDIINDNMDDQVEVFNNREKKVKRNLELMTGVPNLP